MAVGQQRGGDSGIQRRTPSLFSPCLLSSSISSMYSLQVFRPEHGVRSARYLRGDSIGARLVLFHAVAYSWMNWPCCMSNIPDDVDCRAAVLRRDYRVLCGLPADISRIRELRDHSAFTEVCSSLCWIAGFPWQVFRRDQGMVSGHNKQRVTRRSCHGSAILDGGGEVKVTSWLREEER